MYRGIVEWDWSPRDNERRQLRRHENQNPLRIEAPALRIVPEALAASVDAERLERSGSYGKSIVGSEAVSCPDRSGTFRSGLLRCPCGASFEA